MYNNSKKKYKRNNVNKRNISQKKYGGHLLCNEKTYAIYKESYTKITTSPKYEDTIETLKNIYYNIVYNNINPDDKKNIANGADTEILTNENLEKINKTKIKFDEYIFNKDNAVINDEIVRYGKYKIEDDLDEFIDKHIKYIITEFEKSGICSQKQSIEFYDYYKTIVKAEIDSYIKIDELINYMNDLINNRTMNTSTVIMDLYKDNSFSRLIRVSVTRYLLYLKCQNFTYVNNENIEKSSFESVVLFIKDKYCDRKEFYENWTNVKLNKSQYPESIFEYMTNLYSIIDGNIEILKTSLETMLNDKTTPDKIKCDQVREKLSSHTSTIITKTPPPTVENKNKTPPSTVQGMVSYIPTVQGMVSYNSNKNDDIFENIKKIIPVIESDLGIKIKKSSEKIFSIIFENYNKKKKKKNF